MKTTIGAFDPTSRTVTVVFEYDGVTHKRPVNACLNDKGRYDAKATAARIADVANGVKAKVDAGVLTNAPPVPDPVPEPLPED